MAGGGGRWREEFAFKNKKVKQKNVKYMEGGAGAERVVRGHLWRPMGRYWGRGKVLFFAPPLPV